MTKATLTSGYRKYFGNRTSSCYTRHTGMSHPWHVNMVPLEYPKPRETSNGNKTVHFKNQCTPQGCWNFQNCLLGVHARHLQPLELITKHIAGAVARNNQEKKTPI